MLAIVTASSAAAPTTLGKLAEGALGFGGSPSSTADQIALKMLFPIRVAIRVKRRAKGL
jgi:hypothetical protein